MTEANDRRQASRDRRRAQRAPLTAAVAAKRVRGPARLAQAANIGELVIRVRGEVVFDRADGCYRSAGVRFGHVAARDARAIARFVGSAP
jgi:hypothetical protein